MMNANVRTGLMDEELTFVAGGDYGDTDRDNGNTTMYTVGQDVEVYVSSLHICTNRERITKTEHWKTICGTEYWYYTTNKGNRITADHIQG